MSALINQPCIVCANPTSMWCSRCQSAWYCCPEHLRADWGRHRNECLPTPQSASNTVTTYSIIATPPPAEEETLTVAAILFDPHEDRPSLVPIICQPSTKLHGQCPIPLVDDYFQDGSPREVVLTQGLNSENLRFPLQIWYCPTSHNRNYPANQAVSHITANAETRTWCGPVLVLKYNGTRRIGYSDASINDLPTLSAYFIAYQ